MWDGILNGCAWGLAQLAHLVGDWGLAIIIVTLVIRAALFPLQRKQFKSSYDMKKFQPKLKQIQDQYAGDDQKIQEETMKLYQETGFNPLAGCLPMLVQMPIFIILFQVLRWKIGDYWTDELGVTFYNILPNLTETVGDAIANGFLYALPYMILVLLFFSMSMLPMALQLKDGQQEGGQMVIMMIMFGLMFAWMAVISPAGVMLYWALSSGFGVAQQLLTQRKLKKEDEEAAAADIYKPVEVNVERKVKKKRPSKKR